MQFEFNSELTSAENKHLPVIMFVAYTGIHTHMFDLILTNNTGNGILQAQGFFLHLLVCTDAYSAHLLVILHIFCYLLDVA